MRALLVAVVLLAAGAGCIEMSEQPSRLASDQVDAELLSVSNHSIAAGPIKIWDDFVFGVDLQADTLSACSGKLTGAVIARTGFAAGIYDTVGKSWITYKPNSEGDGYYVGPVQDDVAYYAGGVFILSIDQLPFEGARTIWFAVAGGPEGGQMGFELDCPGAEIVATYGGTQVEALTWVDHGDVYNDDTLFVHSALVDHLDVEMVGTHVAYVVASRATVGVGEIETPAGREVLDLSRWHGGPGEPGHYTLRSTVVGDHLVGAFYSATQLDDGAAWLAAYKS